MENNQIFISFSSKEEGEAERVCRFLEKNGYNCFISGRDLIAGKEYAAQLIENIGKSRAVVLLLSENSNNSPHVLREVEYAVSNKVPILVYALEEVELSKSMKYYLMTHQWIPNVLDRDTRMLEGLKNLFPSGEEVSAEKKKEGVKRNSIELYKLLLIAVAALIVFTGIIGLAGGWFGDDDGKKTENISTANSSESGMTASTESGQQSAENGKSALTENGQQSAEVNSSADTGAENSALGASSSIANGDTAGQDETTANILSASEAYRPGDTLTFGSYKGEPVEWRVLNANDEDNTVVLIAKNILTMKIFDAAEGGKYNYYDGVDYYSSANYNIEDDELSIRVRGNNDWSKSNIRTWLNSGSEVVEYTDQAPDRTAVGRTFYNTEPGFLFEFTGDERAALVATEHTTKEYGSEDMVVTKDLVYLLSSDEIALLTAAGMSIYTFPSQRCIDEEGDVSGYNSFVRNYEVNSYYWWLRDNSGRKPSWANAVLTEFESGYTVYDENSVGACVYGIRPAVVADASALQKLSK